MSKKNWYEIKASAKKAAEITLYDEIGMWGITAKDFIGDLKALGEIDSLTVYINSPGGNVYDGNAIYNALKRTGANITVYIDGLAASMASAIAMVGNKIIMPSNAFMMIHNPWNCVAGEAEDFQKAAERLSKIRDVMADIYQSRTGLELSEIKEIMDAETWMTAEEAVQKGFADETEDAVEMAAHFDLSKFSNAPKALISSIEAAIERPVSRISIKQKDIDMKINTEQPIEAAITVDSIKASHSDVYDKIYSEAYAKGVEVENKRIHGIEENALAGHDVLIAEMKADVNISPEQAAIKIINAEKAKGEMKLDAMKSAAKTVPEVKPSSTDTGEEKPAAVDESLPLEDRAKATWQKSPDIRAEFGSFEVYEAYLRAEDNGQVNVYGR